MMEKVKNLVLGAGSVLTLMTTDTKLIPLQKRSDAKSIADVWRAVGIDIKKVIGDENDHS